MAQDIKLTGFEMLELIGQGGMGVVWKARQLSLDRLVAIKLLAAQFAQKPEAVRQIMTEARTAAKLKHSGIVQVYDASEEHGHFFFVMEYVDGYSVGQWLSRSKTLAWKDALVVAEAVALAMDYAWRTARMTHCDIKPENIMVDKDGAIKVADLGLSRTVDSRDVIDESEVMGTPSYMSPEQVRGDVPLDCRADIYSLGATLYQMLTGRRMFQEKRDSEAMDCMLTEQVPDPRDVVQTVPANVCALLERMLAKDREGRPKDWAAVVTDIRRVEKGLMPSTKAVAPGKSTVNCRKFVVRKRDEGDSSDATTGKSRGPFQFMLEFLLLLLLAAVAVWFFFLRGHGVETPVTVPGGPARPAVTAPSAQTLSGATVLSDTRHWAQSHPRDLDGAVSRFREVISRYPGSREAALALDEIKAIGERRASDRQRVWEELEQRVQKSLAKNRLDEALLLTETYSGPWAAETASNRTVLAKGIRLKIDERQVSRQADAKWQKFLDGVAESLVNGRIAAAQQTISNAVAEGSFPSHNDELASVTALLQGTGQLNDRVLQSFRGDIGNVLALKRGQGEIKVKITSVGNQRVIGETADGAQMLFSPDELVPAERLARLGPADVPEVALVRGMAAVGAKSFAEAEELFSATGPVMSKPLTAKVHEMNVSAPPTDPAEAALTLLVGTAGANVGRYDETAWLTALRSCRLTKEIAATVNEQREKFLEGFGTSEFAIKAAPVLLFLEQVCQQAVEAKGGEESGAPTAVAKDQPGVKTLDLAAIREALKAKNLTLESEQVTTYEGTNGAGIVIAADSVLDLGPLANLRGIKGLRLETDSAHKIPVDVRPLAGTDIVELKLQGFMIKDPSYLRYLHLRSLAIPGATAGSIGALEGLQLVELDLSGAAIRELSVLRGMKLEVLNLDDTKVISLMVLAGMPLRDLSLRNTPIRDVSVLRTLPLQSLNLAQTSAFDYQVLRGLNLRTLNLRGTSTRDISFCAGMPLAELDLADTPVMDLSPLKGKSMDVLVLARTPVKDISALEGAAIGSLDLTAVHVPQRALADTLEKVSIKSLNLSETDVGTVAFLAGKALTELNIKNTRVKDLAPLSKMPLQSLNFQGTSVLDYEPLQTMKLREVYVNGEWRSSRRLLVSLPGLRSINGRPPGQLGNDAGDL